MPTPLQRVNPKPSHLHLYRLLLRRTRRTSYNSLFLRRRRLLGSGLQLSPRHLVYLVPLLLHYLSRPVSLALVIISAFTRADPWAASLRYFSCHQEHDRDPTYDCPEPTSRAGLHSISTRQARGYCLGSSSFSAEAR